jgi:N-acylneuraminate cytidylyltransferase/CMP-N,N'-diacetyllegionaminic acid synthase
MKRICTICARGGSKGLPGKNIRPLLGKPMLLYSIEVAQESGLFDRIAVSSDSSEILSLARAAGVSDIVERPFEMATDQAAKCPAIRHALLTVEQRHNEHFDVQVDLAVTAPLRLAGDVAGAVALLETARVSSVITGTPARNSPYFSLVEEAADGSVALSKKADIVRRQDAPRTFDMDGSIYVWDTAVFRAEPKVFYPDTRLFVVPEERSQDVDTEIDFAIVEMLMKRRLAKAGVER